MKKSSQWSRERWWSYRIRSSHQPTRTCTLFTVNQQVSIVGGSTSIWKIWSNWSISPPFRVKMTSRFQLTGDSGANLRKTTSFNTGPVLIWFGSSQIFETKEGQKLQWQIHTNTTVAHPWQNAQDSHAKQTNTDTASHVSAVSHELLRVYSNNKKQRHANTN